MTPCAAILDAEGLSLTREEQAFFRDANPFGFILFARNIDTADQVRGLCAQMREAVGRDAPILVDQEGGRVQRLRPPLARNWTAPLDFVAQAGAQAEAAMRLRALLMAWELHAVGIDVNCAPMADLAREETHAFLKNRCYGSEAAQVGALARAVAQGQLAGGVLPVVKHMPGHGRSVADSHSDLPLVTTELDELQATDFAAFRAVADLPMGMTGHVVYSALSAKPATISAEVITMIRAEIGFDGLLMTDDLSMNALQGEPADRARAALDAGCDLALFCNAPLAERIAVADAAGDMTQAGLDRAAAALALRKAPEAVDAQEVENALRKLVDGPIFEVRT